MANFAGTRASGDPLTPSPPRRSILSSQLSDSLNLSLLETLLKESERQRPTPLATKRTILEFSSKYQPRQVQDPPTPMTEQTRATTAMPQASAYNEEVVQMSKRAMIDMKLEELDSSLDNIDDELSSFFSSDTRVGLLLSAFDHTHCWTMLLAVLNGLSVGFFSSCLCSRVRSPRP